MYVCILLFKRIKPNNKLQICFEEVDNRVILFSYDFFRFFWNIYL